jgi:hypothetical protein
LDQKKNAAESTRIDENRALKLAHIYCIPADPDSGIRIWRGACIKHSYEKREYAYFCIFYPKKITKVSSV